MFEGLSFLSPEYGMLDYIRGQYPIAISPIDEEIFVQLLIPRKEHTTANYNDEQLKNETAITPCKAVIRVPITGKSLNLLSNNDSDIVYRMNESIANLSIESSIFINNDTAGDMLQNTNCPNICYIMSHENYDLTLTSVLRAVEGLKATSSDRLRILSIRMQCMLIAVHSCTLHEKLTPYIATHSLLIKDLLILSDIAAESTVDLGLSASFLPTITTFLQCTTGLLQHHIRRRGLLLTSFINELGLSKSMYDSRGLVNATHNGYEAHWVSIVIAASATGGNIFSDSFIPRDEARSSTIANISSSQCDHATPSNLCAAVKPLGILERSTSLILSDQAVDYIMIAIDLFGAALSTRDAHHTVMDTPVLGAVIGLAQWAVEPMRAAFRDYGRDAERGIGITERENSFRLLESRLLRPMAKILSSINNCFGRHGYGAAFRECEGLVLVTTTIEACGSCSSNLDALLKNKYYSRLVELAMTLLDEAIESHRGAVHNPADSGVQVLHQTYFSQLCGAVFASSLEENVSCWIAILMLIRTAIGAEPSFLAQFLRSSHAAVLTRTLQSVRSSFPTHNFNEKLILPVVKLASTMCFTPSGQQYVLSNKMITLAIESALHSSHLLPKSKGLSLESVLKLGRILMQLTKDCQPLQQPVISCLESNLRTLCIEAEQIWSEFSHLSSTDYSTPRMQVLQKIAYICAIIDSMASEASRRHTSDALREILNVEVTKGLIAAFSCTFPPSQQLFAQLALRHNSTFAYFGFGAAARAITAVVKLSTSLSPEATIPIIFAAIDNCLGQISASKAALCSCAHVSAPEATIKGNSEVGLRTQLPTPGAAEAIEGTSKRLRGSSFDQPGSNVFILGVLDSVPHRCVFDELLKSSMHVDVEKHLWEFQCSTLYMEWLTSVLLVCLKSIPRSQGLGVIMAGKDIFRRMFAFQRSSMLEVCRFASSKWTPKVIGKYLALCCLRLLDLQH